MRAPKKPCAECPWRKDVPTGRFPPERYRALAHTAYDIAEKVFACHKSTEEEPIACAGFVLRGGLHNLSLRLAYARGSITRDSVTDGGYPLFGNYREVAAANGVSATDPVLRLCR